MFSFFLRYKALGWFKRIWFIGVPKNSFGHGQLSLSCEVCIPSTCSAIIIWHVCVFACVRENTRSCNNIEVLVSAAFCNCCNHNFRKEKSKLEWFKFFWSVETSAKVCAWARSISA